MLEEFVSRRIKIQEPFQNFQYPKHPDNVSYTLRNFCIKLSLHVMEVFFQ